jgi:hypothetical protein
VVPFRAMRSGRLGAVVLLVAVVLVMGILAMVLRIVAPAAPSAHLAARAPFGPPLTKRLALVVLDGVRFDVATDGRRMPRLAERFHSHAGADLWAEPISMTASAATVFGTGAHADLSLAIRNETAQPTLFEDLFTIARVAHLRTGTVGDQVWVGLYPKGWDVTRAEPHRLAVGLDDDAAAFASAEALQALDLPVDVGVYHFPTPDHMAHGFGVASPVYEAYIKGFDAGLEAMLERFSRDTTVIVVGDHGATLAGIHGSNTDEQRRTLIIAYGPGIVAGAHAFPPVDEVDLAPTMAALLGVATPRSARGAPLASWLDASDASRAAIACANVLDLARALGPGADSADGAQPSPASASVAPACDPQRPPAERVASALPLARALDARLDAEEAASQRRGFGLSLFAAGLTAVLSFLLFFRTISLGSLAVSGLAFAIALGFSVFVTANLEKLPGAWLTPARITLFAVFNGPLLLWVIRPVSTSRILDRAPLLASLLLPGVLVLTETHSALIEAYVLSVVLVGFVLKRSLRASAGGPTRTMRAVAGSRLVSWPALVALAVVCIDAGNFVPNWLQNATGLQLALAAGSLVAFAAVRYVRLRPPLIGAVACTALAALALVLRRVAPAPVCLVGWAALAVLAAVAIRRKQRAYAELLAFGSYAWVSRDLEVPLFFASYLVAVAFGEAVARHLAREGDGEGPPSVDGSRYSPRSFRVLALSLVSFAFAWGYVQSAGLQLGLHFMHFDFGAGVFRDADVSMARIVFALVYKYAVARGFLLFGLLLPLPTSMRLLALRSLVALYALRATVLVASLEAARRSFWTPVWVTSELPHVLLALLIVATATAYGLAAARHSLREASAHV